jgi:6-phosphofructokinase 1
MEDHSSRIVLDHISHLTLTAPTKEIYHASVAWFEQLGLKAIMTESSADTTATWLQLFSNTASVHDASLKIAYSPSGLRKLPQSDKMDWRSLPAIATITTHTLKVWKESRSASYGLELNTTDQWPCLLSQWNSVSRALHGR